jgi:hypothetical protein
VIPATPAFTAALAYSHRTLTRVTAAGIQLPIESGSVTMNRAANVRRTASLTLRDDPATPGLLDSLDTATQLVIEKGIQFLDGSSEYVTIATLYLQEHESDPARQAMTIALSDAGQLVDDYPLVYAWAPVTGTTPLTVVAAIKTLVDDALPGTLTWDVDAAISTTQSTLPGSVYKAGTGRWSAINELASMLGAAVYPGPDDTWHITPATVTAAPVAVVASGAGGVLVKASVKGSRRDIFNGVGIEWGSTDVEGGIVLIVDDDPASPTYWDGPWGRKPKPTIKLAVTTQAQAVVAGTAALAGLKGAQSGISFQSVYNPLLEPSDVVTVAPSPSSGQDHVLDRITLPVDGGVMTAETRIVAIA